MLIFAGITIKWLKSAIQKRFTRIADYLFIIANEYFVLVNLPSSKTYSSRDSEKSLLSIKTRAQFRSRVNFFGEKGQPFG